MTEEKLPLQVVGYDKNMGLAHALNYGLQFINTELVARMDTEITITLPDPESFKIEGTSPTPEVFLAKLFCSSGKAVYFTDLTFT